MNRYQLVLSDAAVADILEQADWYGVQSGQVLAKRWEKTVTSALLRIVKHPSAGTPCRFGREELRDVRRATIAGFPSICSFTDSTGLRYSFLESYMARVIWRASFEGPARVSTPTLTTR